MVGENNTVARREFLKYAGLLAAGLGAGCSTVTTDYEKAQKHFEEGDYIHAIRWLDDVIAQEPDNPDAHYYRGMSYFNLNQFNEAIVDYDAAIKHTPHAKLYTNRGFAYSMRAVTKGAREDADRAITDFEQSLKLHAASPDAHAGMGYTRVFQEDFDKAYASFKEALRLVKHEQIPFKHLQDERVEQAYKMVRERLGINDDPF